MHKKHLTLEKKLAILLFVLALVIINLSTHRHFNKLAGTSYDYSIPSVEGQPIKIVRAIDGDTVELVNGTKLRYIGIDTPEEVDERKPVQCFAQAAAEKNRELVEGKEIIYYKDVTAKDQYDRLLGFVYLQDGTFVNLEMVKQGYAFAYPYPPDISKADQFSEAERQAREGKLGLWTGCQVYKTSSGREQTNPVE